MQDLMRNVSNSYKDFSSGQKKIGDLFFKEPIFLAFSSALEVGKRVNVSESTVIRWSQKLGYRGYAEFQHVLQRKLVEERFEQVEEAEAAPAVEQSFLANLLDADIASIVQLKQTTDEDQLLQAVDAIGQAENIYVTSNFFDFGLAHFMATWLNLTLDHAELLMHGDGQYYRQLAALSSEDTVIAFVFPRYTKSVIDTLATAKKQGAKIVLITDSKDSPASDYADITLEVYVSSNLNIDSYTAVHALIASIMRFIYVKEHSKVKRNLAKVEAIYTEKEVFI
ncbi:MurR/RpiR family transcriptional regulator [Planococcus sp. CAU13]|uniref:MurR/RpiR family transcriptional regulator n=1 Tax=Planococcus sp. CAU13 TaxID=1541197 RepID=UPI00053009EB|nr:MurR/RpiR family transcriptional regulator [Planococcus sp. CAU13]